VATDVHELTAAYALDALDAEDRAAYEAHLASCERCRSELGALQDAAAQLAYGAPAPAPPPHLRDRVLEAVREDGGVVRPLRQRSRIPYVLAAAAAALAALALGLGVWGNSVSGELEAQRALVEILADADARELPLESGAGRVVVTDAGEAALVVDGLGPAPSGKTYEIWVLDTGDPQPAGLFDGSRSGRDVVRLSRPVPSGARVAVTVEPDGGVDAPTTDPVAITRS
jgi:anti-sigma-K factor RskA